MKNLSSFSMVGSGGKVRQELKCMRRERALEIFDEHVQPSIDRKDILEIEIQRPSLT